MSFLFKKALKTQIISISFLLRVTRSQIISKSLNSLGYFSWDIFVFICFVVFFSLVWSEGEDFHVPIRIWQYLDPDLMTVIGVVWSPSIKSDQTKPTQSWWWQAGYLRIKLNVIGRNFRFKNFRLWASPRYKIQRPTVCRHCACPPQMPQNCASRLLCL